MQAATTVLKPSACTPEVLESFCSLVLEGGQVITQGLKERVRNAFAVALVYDEKILAAIGALKLPDADYRASIFEKAGLDEDPTGFRYELGWVFVAAAYRGKKLSRLPVEALLPLVADEGLFATSRVERLEMHNTLKRYRLSLAGTPYKSDIDNHKLIVFLRKSTGVDGRQRSDLRIGRRS